MRKALTIVGLTLACIVCVLTAVFLWPAAHYDMYKVHPAIRELATPYQKVDADIVGDGGSVLMRIVDHVGRELRLRIPVSYDGSRPDYSQLFLTNGGETGLVELAYSQDTKRMLVDAVERHVQPAGNRYVVLTRLRGWPKDYVHLYFNVYGWHIVDMCKDIWREMFATRR